MSWMPPHPDLSRSTVMETGPILPDPYVFGRDEVKNKLIGLLLGTTTTTATASSSSAVRPTSLSVVSLVGMGGLGKTTLSQWVYNSKPIQEHFHLRMWVWVSREFDLTRVTKQILQHLVDPQSGVQKLDNLNVLQEILVERLKGKRFLLILDDVWEKDITIWRQFSAPLALGDTGSRVLLTTRDASVANAVRSVKIELDCLSSDDCWSIFEKHAFAGAQSHSSRQNLEPIGKEIVRKLKGVPLAATAIGGLLRFEPEESKWRDVLQNELWESEQVEQGIFPALKLSYEYLPLHLKQCFAYCSLFHKGYNYDVLELVQQWMAHGYVPPPGRRPMEDVGRGFFNELFNRSLIQLVNGRYVIHHLLHDLGQLILREDFHQMGPGQVHRIPEDAHSKLHLKVHYEESLGGELAVLCKFRSLRTLSFWFSGFADIQVPIGLFQTVKRLRMLDLGYSSIDALPDSVGCLKHLRYLDLRGTKITCLPDSLCTLYKLQTLKLQGCDQLQGFPDGMSNLISLHYLEATQELVSSIAKLGKLTQLQSLEAFSVSEENGNRIGELKSMNGLRGKLCIRNLQRVATREEAVEAALKDKRYLKTLEMEWAGDRDVNQIDSDLEKSIIDGLQPPPQLKELIVKSYAGTKLPSWMNSSSISSLELIRVERCTSLNQLPTSLVSLVLREVRLSTLPDILCHLPLQQLMVCQSPELSELPSLPTTLKELVIECVGLKSLPEFNQDHGLSDATSRRCDEDEGSDSRKPLLSILKIHSCPHLTTLDKGLLQCCLRHLQVLSIKDCEELVKWPVGEGFQATLCSLEGELSITDCPKLSALPEGSKLSASLKNVTVCGCPGITNESFFGHVHDLNSDDVRMNQQFSSASRCAEMLRHIKDVNWLSICYIFNSIFTTPQVLIKYDRLETYSWGLKKNSLHRRVMMVICTAPVVDGAEVDDDVSKLLYMCLGGHHPWSSSLRILSLKDIPVAAFLGFQHIHEALCLPSIERLQIFSCGEMGQLLTRLTALKDLSVNECAELTLPCLVEGIRSAPYLDELHIYKCPKLLMPTPSSPSNDTACEEVLGSPPPLPGPPPLTLLRNLGIDDIRVLTRLLVSKPRCIPLRALRIDGAELTSLMEEEEGFGALAPSLQLLALFHCPNLQNLHTDLRAFLPNLKILWVDHCPNLRCLPDRGLPMSLEFLRVNQCPALVERCRRALPSIGGAEEDDWGKMAHVPVIAIDGAYQRGSYSRVLELQARLDFTFC